MKEKMRNKGFLAKVMAVGVCAVMFIFSGSVLAEDNIFPNNGKVGIGTTIPKRGLHVQTPESWRSVGAGVLISGGLVGNANIELRNQAGGTPYIDFSTNTGDYDMRIRQTGNDSLAIEGGNVGIGRTNPIEKLEVAGNIKLSGNLISDGDICIGNCN